MWIIQMPPKNRLFSCFEDFSKIFPKYSISCGAYISAIFLRWNLKWHRCYPSFNGLIAYYFCNWFSLITSYTILMHDQIPTQKEAMVSAHDSTYYICYIPVESVRNPSCPYCIGYHLSIILYFQVWQCCAKE